MTGMWRLAMPAMRLGMLLALLGVVQAVEISSQELIVKSERSFTIENDRFVKDGKPLQIISGRFDTEACLTQSFWCICFTVVSQF